MVLIKSAGRDSRCAVGTLLRILEGFESTPIRVIVKDGEPYFCLADVCANLDLDSSQVSKRLEGEVITIHPIKDRLGRLNRLNRLESV